MGVSVILQSLEDLEANQAQVEMLIEKGLYGNKAFSTKAYFDACCLGDLHFFLVKDDEQIVGGFTTQVVAYESYHDLSVLSFFVENFERVKNEVNVVLDRFAKLLQCAHIVSLSRRGMEKLMTEFGYEAKMVLMEKTLSEKLGVQNG
jgi:hypothetical protein